MKTLSQTELLQQYNGALAIIDRQRKDLERMKDAAEMLWIVLANVSQGNWNDQTPEWREAARRWQMNYHSLCSELHLKTA